MTPTVVDVRAAAERIAPHVRRTPVITCPALDEMTGATLYFKCENLQEAGAFKSRGAVNAVFSLSETEAARGVVTHSSGNHAAALSRAAGLRGIRATVVMPETAPAVKVAAVRGYGGEIVFCKPTLAAREEAARRIIDQTGAVLIHPYDDDRIIAGQGTAALELLAEVPDLDAVIAPVGGGGLLSGTAIAATGIKPGVAVFGAEPAGADDAFRSLAEGRIVPSVEPKTIADGLLTSLCERTYSIIKERVAAILVADDDAIVRAMRLLRDEGKTLVEPSGAVPLAALLGQHPLRAGPSA